MKGLDWVAVYGALLSTLIFVRELFSARHKLRIRVFHGVDLTKSKDTCAVVRIANHGSRSLMLFHVGMKYKWRDETLLDKLRHTWRFKRWPRHPGWVGTSLPGVRERHNFPMVIEPLQSADFWIPIPDIESALTDGQNMIIATAQDAIGRNSCSKPFTLRLTKA